MTTRIDVENFTKTRGNPNLFYSGIRWFNIDGQMVQVHGRSWQSVEKLVLENYPNAKSIELLTK